MKYADMATQKRRAPSRPDAGGEMGLGHHLARLLRIVLAMSLGPAASCRAAGLVIEAPNLTVAPGSSGSFDVLLVNTNAAGGTSFGVSLDSLELALSGSAGVAFTNVTINTIVPYIYPISATTLPGSNPLNFGISFPNTGFTVADSDGGSPFFQTVSPGGGFGLANVSYTVSSTFSGTDTIAITSLNVGTSLSDINGNLIPFTAMNGSISTAVVPEPGTLALAAIATLFCLPALLVASATKSAGNAESCNRCQIKYSGVGSIS
jgi:hypothetical protein